MPSRPRRSHVLLAAALATLLAAAPLLPDRRDDDGPALAPASGRTATAGAGRVTPELRAEIDRVVAQGLAAPRLSARATPERLAADQVRCAELEGQRYCLGQGWTKSSPDQVRQRIAAAARASAASARLAPAEDTGDLDALELMRMRAAMTPQERAEQERAELEEAARSVAKVWLLRNQIEGTPLPPGFARRHPEAVGLGGTTYAASDGSVSLRTAASSTKTPADYPQRATIISSKKVSEQTRSYWCGPATMQMIEWGWTGTKESQYRWAERLGTTTSGTAITAMVSVTNRYTGWDRDSRAGRYVTLDIGGYGFRKWWLLMMRHIEDYRAPVILHPVLRKEYYSYLDDDASGHFQMGRGYDKKYDKPNLLSYFEPWNQQRFDPSEPYIKRLQWYNAYQQYRANKAHFQHNVGV